jgi:hypothetical protein
VLEESVGDFNEGGRCRDRRVGGQIFWAPAVVGDGAADRGLRGSLAGEVPPSAGWFELEEVPASASVYEQHLMTGTGGHEHGSPRQPPGAVLEQAGAAALGSVGHEPLASSDADDPCGVVLEDFGQVVTLTVKAHKVHGLYLLPLKSGGRADVFEGAVTERDAVERRGNGGRFELVSAGWRRTSAAVIPMASARTPGLVPRAREQRSIQESKASPGTGGTM